MSLNKNVMEKPLETFQQDGLDYLYNLEPTQNNLFWVGNFKSISSTSPKIIPNTQYRVQSLNFGSTKLSFEYNEKLKQNLLSAVEAPKTVSISWLDDYRRSIQQIHLDWCGKWYDRNKDALKNGNSKEKFKNCEVYLFHYFTEKNNELYQPKIELIAGVELKGLVPINGVNFEFNMASSNSGEAVSYEYALNAVHLKFFEKTEETGFTENEFTKNGGEERAYLANLSKDFNS